MWDDFDLESDTDVWQLIDSTIVENGAIGPSADSVAAMLRMSICAMGSQYAVSMNNVHENFLGRISWNNSIISWAEVSEVWKPIQYIGMLLFMSDDGVYTNVIEHDPDIGSIRGLGCPPRHLPHAYMKITAPISIDRLATILHA